MLRSVEIRDLLIIDRLELEFQPGLNVLTGETGAGKSILLDALGFVLGWRGRADIVRPGADEGEVVAVFELPPGHEGRAILEEAGFNTSDDDELILRRVVKPDGRKTAWINERRTSADTLRVLSETLVEVHGQHDDRGLMNARGHAAMLDGFAGLAEMRDKARRSWRNWKDAEVALSNEKARLKLLQEEEDYLRHSVSELDLLSPKAGEADKLDADRRVMQAAGKIGEDVLKAADTLGADGAEGALLDAMRWLEDVAGKAEGRLDDAISSVSRALNEVAEAQHVVRSALDDLSFDPRELERVEDRLFSLRGLARKHSVRPDDLAELADELKQKLSELDGGQANVETLAENVARNEASYYAASSALFTARSRAARQLDKAMVGELEPLKLGNARFITSVEQIDNGPEGSEVTFSVATNPGAPAGPLNKIASGGELSRFLLALKVCLTRGDANITMIFDEIDRGVGGATADAVGRRLAKLARDSQVLVVTHSPQVAARGMHHWQVSKAVKSGETFSEVSHLDEGRRVDEIARMLAGDKITEEARSAARALLAG